MCASRDDAGVVHQDIDGTELSHGLLEKRRNALLVRDVALPCPCTSAGGAHRRFERARVILSLAVGNADGRSALDQELRNASADAARAAGDDGDPAVKKRSEISKFGHAARR